MADKNDWANRFRELLRIPVQSEESGSRSEFRDRIERLQETLVEQAFDGEREWFDRDDWWVVCADDVQNGRVDRDIPRNPDGSLPECWLLAEWPPHEPEPTDYWLSTLPTDTRLRDLVRLARIRWRIEHDHRELKDGLDHFEGRYLGWQRHVTLAAPAQAFRTRLRYDPQVPAPV